MCESGLSNNWAEIYKFSPKSAKNQATELNPVADPSKIRGASGQQLTRRLRIRPRAPRPSIQIVAGSGTVIAPLNPPDPVASVSIMSAKV